MPSAGRPLVDSLADWENILDVPARRAIVRACSGSGKTASEIAKTLNRARQGIESTVQNLADWGFLEIEARSRRGAAIYRATAAGLGELRRWMRVHAPEFVRLGQQTVIVFPPHAAAVSAGIADEGLEADVEWAVSVGADELLLIGLVDGSTPARAAQLASAAGSAPQARAAPVSEVIEGDQFEGFVRGARATAEPGAA